MKDCIVLLGAPGSGKSTQITRLRGLLPSHPVIATGDIARTLRAGAYADDPHFKHIQEHYDTTKAAAIAEGRSGRGIETQVMVSCMEIVLADMPQIILDGFPRSVEQTEWLTTRFPTEDIAVIELAIEREASIDRLLSRMREDDSHEAAVRRYNIYVEARDAIVAAFRQRGVVTTVVDGAQTPDEIHTALRNILGV